MDQSFSGSCQRLDELTKFSVLCRLCDRLVSIRRPERRKEMLSRYINEYRQEIRRRNQACSVVDSDLEPETTYPLMRLLLPYFDSERPAYGIKENKLAKLYIQILGLNKDSADAKRLLHYKRPTSRKSDEGDFGEVAYSVLYNRCLNDGNFTIAQVNEKLDAIAINNTTQKPELVEKDLVSMLHGMSAREQKLLIRVILKQVRFGLGTTGTLHAFHPDAKDLYDVCNSLRKVCATLHDPTVRLHEIGIQLFTAFRPMLAERGAMDKLEKQLDCTKFYQETKHDGERFQLHKNGEEYMYFSRNGFDYTAEFGASPREGGLTPFIHRAFASSVKSCILDGEMMPWDKNYGILSSKGENKDVKHLSTTSTDHHPCYFVFDVLFHNGQVLTNKPLKDRLEVLKNIFQPVESRLEFTPRREMTSKKEVIAALNGAIDNEEEGLVLKNPNSIYKPNARKGWIKIKPDYVDELIDSLDLLIIGGYFGRRTNVVSHFLLGVAVPPANPEEKPSVFHSIGKVGSGYTLTEIHELHQQLKSHWQKVDRKRNKDGSPDGSILWSKEKPDLWINPRLSKIVEVKATELVASDAYMTGWTLRFPRLVTHRGGGAERTDKTWDTCMTTVELDQIRGGSSSGRQLRVGRLLPGAVSPPAKKRRLGGGARSLERPGHLPLHFQSADLKGVEKRADLLRGKEFCVVSGAPPHDKKALEKLVVKYGGRITQNPGPATFAVISDRLNFRMKMIVQSGKNDCVRSSWFLRCLRDCRLLPFKPLDLFGSTQATARQMEKHFDRFGDSYAEDITLEGLKDLLHNILSDEAEQKMEDIPHLPEASLQDMESDVSDLLEEPDEFSLFLGSRFYFDRSSSQELASPAVALETTLTQTRARMHGAKIASSLEEDFNVTHVIIDQRDVSRLESIRSLNHSRQRKFHLVCSEWLKACVESQRIVPERGFGPDALIRSKRDEPVPELRSR